MLIDGKGIAAEVREEIKAEIATFSGQLTPGLAVILVGEDPASQVYVRNKRKMCAAVGIHSEEYKMDKDTPESEVLARIAQLNQDPKIHGILVQLPLPKQIDSRRVLDAVSPEKDVDGFHYLNVGKLVANRPALVSCTPRGVIELLDRSHIDIEGANAVVVGRSDIVGKPTALLLLHRNATVTLCHSRTRDLSAVCREADILIAAIGKAHFITEKMVKPGATVIDVGINRLPNGKLAGDVDFAAVSKIAGAITPVPGGVGPMTIAMLLSNTLCAAKWARESQ